MGDGVGDGAGEGVEEEKDDLAAAPPKAPMQTAKSKNPFRSNHGDNKVGLFALKKMGADEETGSRTPIQTPSRQLSFTLRPSLVPRTS